MGGAAGGIGGSDWESDSRSWAASVSSFVLILAKAGGGVSRDWPAPPPPAEGGGVQMEVGVATCSGGRGSWSDWRIGPGSGEVRRPTGPGSEGESERVMRERRKTCRVS